MTAAAKGVDETVLCVIRLESDSFVILSSLHQWIHAIPKQITSNAALHTPKLGNRDFVSLLFDHGRVVLKGPPSCITACGTTPV
jgi:hypothetical protein